MEFYDHTFTLTDELPPVWAGHEYEACTFQGLDLTEADFKAANLIDCTFQDCNLAGARFSQAKLQTISFRTCKMTGVDFSPVADFGLRLSFQACQMELVLFIGKNLKKTRLEDCALREAHFHRCDLAEAVFTRCELDQAQFQECNLTKADFASSTNLRLNPDDNQLKGAMLSLYHLPALVEKYGIQVL